MDYGGVIIEESLQNKSVLKSVEVVSTKIEPITERHKTPWLKQWTLHTFKISAAEAKKVADSLSKALEPNYWYADFKNDKTHFVIFPNKIFRIDRGHPEQYQAVTEYGLSLGIPDYQLDFSPTSKRWKRPQS